MTTLGTGVASRLYYTRSPDAHTVPVGFTDMGDAVFVSSRALVRDLLHHV